MASFIKLFILAIIFSNASLAATSTYDGYNVVDFELILPDHPEYKITYKTLQINSPEGLESAAQFIKNETHSDQSETTSDITNKTANVDVLTLTEEGNPANAENLADEVSHVETQAKLSFRKKIELIPKNIYQKFIDYEKSYFSKNNYTRANGKEAYVRNFTVVKIVASGLSSTAGIIVSDSSVFIHKFLELGVLASVSSSLSYYFYLKTPQLAKWLNEDYEFISKWKKNGRTKAAAITQAGIGYGKFFLTEYPFVTTIGLTAAFLGFSHTIAATTFLKFAIDALLGTLTQGVFTIVNGKVYKDRIAQGYDAQYSKYLLYRSELFVGIVSTALVLISTYIPEFRYILGITGTLGWYLRKKAEEGKINLGDKAKFNDFSSYPEWSPTYNSIINPQVKARLRCQALFN